MRTVIKEVYYCEYCNKRYLSKSWMTRHENRCTANPGRQCGMCENEIDIKKLIDKYENCYTNELVETGDLCFPIDYDFDWLKNLTIKDLMFDTECCPACTLTVLRICKLAGWEAEERFKFDYKKEKGLWWKEHNVYGEPGYCY